MKSFWIFVFCISNIFTHETLSTEKLALFSKLVYQDLEKLEKNGTGLLAGFVKFNTVSDKKTGFAAISYINTSQNKLVISYRGTNDAFDVLSDLAIGNASVFDNKNSSTADIINNILQNMIVAERYPCLYKYIQVNSLFFQKNSTDELLKKIQDIDPGLATEFLLDESFQEKRMKKAKRKVRYWNWFQKASDKMDGASKAEKYLLQNIKSAQTFFLSNRDMVVNSFSKDCQIYITGHSLGGGYAQIIGAQYSIPTETFGAPGMLEIFEKYIGNVPNDVSNITNHAHLEDIVPQIGTHLGKLQTYPNPLPNIQEQQEKIEKFGDDLYKDMKQNLRKDLLRFKVYQRKRIDSTIEKLQKESTSLETKIHRIQYLKLHFHILDELKAISSQKRLLFLKEKDLVSKYNREEIIKFDFECLMGAILHNHSMKNYCLTFKNQ